MTCDIDAETEVNEDGKSPDSPIWSEIMWFFSNPRKPMILALARPDPKKNLTTLVKAFGECRPLRELSNLMLIMGNRDNIDEMSSTNSSILLSILKLIDKYDLFGQVAYLKHHRQSDVPDIYRLATKTKVYILVEEVVNGFDETDLHRFWVKAVDGSSVAAKDALNTLIKGEGVVKSMVIMENLIFSPPWKLIDLPGLERKY